VLERKHRILNLEIRYQNPILSGDRRVAAAWRAADAQFAARFWVCRCPAHRFTCRSIAAARQRCRQCARESRWRTAQIGGGRSPSNTMYIVHNRACVDMVTRPFNFLDAGNLTRVALHGVPVRRPTGGWGVADFLGTPRLLCKRFPVVVRLHAQLLCGART